ncbi:MAG TPA: type IV-A pilus assembly ATPase PilB [Elusimicrobiota bacterium]|jgi:type IV pilus assembly protein PilB|nr:type IV-A pilus assembly ATPase PilB [Elusimicrobiota bacterium]
MANVQHLISIGLSRRLADLLVEENLISSKQLQEALDAQKSGGDKLGTLLLDMGFLSEDKLLQFLAEKTGISFVSLADIGDISDEAIAAVPEAIARQKMLIPFNKTKDRLTVAIADPLDVMVLDDLKMLTGCEVVGCLASEAEIIAAHEKYYKQETSQEALEDIVARSAENEAAADAIEHVEEKDDKSNEASLEKEAEDAPVIKMVNLIMAGAVKTRASDIHIEPYQKELRIRYRIDGVLHEQPCPPKKFHNAICARIKIMSNLNIAEKRVPQDGRLKLKIDGKEIDMRVSVLPCAPGEKIVMRILDSSGLKVNMTQLGFEPEAMAVFKKAMEAPYGVNLVTGPTGSGKSTTLYSALANLNTPDTNIITAEDPVEYQLKGINQVQIHNQVGLTFAAALRSFLRQDPDVIMVGEIRDQETATIAINAALTGHLVFSTLHTNDTSQTITRLGMMGVEPFLISAAMLMVEAQRLLRTICPKCKEAYEVEKDLLLNLGVPEAQLQQTDKGKVLLYKGKGCENCATTGYRGRAGLYEVMEVTDALRQLILDRASAKEIKKQSMKQGMLTLRMCAVRKLLSGATTIEEMLRVTASDGEG